MFAKRKRPEKIAKSFWGYSFIIFNTILSPKRRNPLFEWAKSAFKPTAPRRTRKRAKSMEIQFAASGKRSPWAAAPQADLHLVSIVAKVFFLPYKIAKKQGYTLMLKAIAKRIKQCNKARQNRTFAKRYLERGDCLSPKRNGVKRWDGKGEFLRLSNVRYPAYSPAKRGENRDAENS